jgi:hypothetical protein
MGKVGGKSDGRGGFGGREYDWEDAEGDRVVGQKRWKGMEW